MYLDWIQANIPLSVHLFCNPNFISDSMDLVGAIWILLKQLTRTGSILIMVENLLQGKIIHLKRPWNTASNFQIN